MKASGLTDAALVFQVDGRGRFGPFQPSIPMSASRLSTLFQQSFGQPPVVTARAPGRVEFIGNHTDYNGGAVLGVAIDRGIEVAAAPATAGRFRVRSIGGATPVELSGPPPVRLTGKDAW